MASIYDMTAKLSNGESVSLKQWQGKSLLIVNTASHCGFTNQYEGLEKIYKDYKDKGFEILAFPCNQFGAQEPGSNEEISTFCRLNYSTSFPLFQKIDVNGETAHPLFDYLTDALPGVLGSKAIKWNFTKFFIDKTGKPIKRFASQDKPEDIITEIAPLF